MLPAPRASSPGELQRDIDLKAEQLQGLAWRTYDLGCISGAGELWRGGCDIGIAVSFAIPHAAAKADRFHFGLDLDLIPILAQPPQEDLAKQLIAGRFCGAQAFEWRSIERGPDIVGRKKVALGAPCRAPDNLQRARGQLLRNIPAYLGQ